MVLWVKPQPLKLKRQGHDRKPRFLGCRRPVTRIRENTKKCIKRVARNKLLNIYDWSKQIYKGFHWSKLFLREGTAGNAARASRPLTDGRRAQEKSTRQKRSKIVMKRFTVFRRAATLQMPVHLAPGPHAIAISCRMGLGGAESRPARCRRTTKATKGFVTMRHYGFVSRARRVGTLRCPSRIALPRDSAVGSTTRQQGSGTLSLSSGRDGRPLSGTTQLIIFSKSNFYFI